MSDEEHKAKLVALMERAVEQARPPFDPMTNLWDWYAGHALGGIMSASPNMTPEMIGHRVATAVNAVLKERPKT